VGLNPIIARDSLEKWPYEAVWAAHGHQIQDRRPGLDGRGERAAPTAKTGEPVVARHERQ